MGGFTYRLSPEKAERIRRFKEAAEAKEGRRLTWSEMKELGYIRKVADVKLPPNAG